MPGSPPPRRTFLLFDALFARLVELSDRALVVFVNGLFGADLPWDARVDRLSTAQHDGHGPRYPDLVLRIAGVTFHVEAQTGRDGLMAVRVFSYGYREAVRTRRRADGVTVLELPQARVVYLEAGARSAEVEVLRLVFPDGSVHDYRIDSVVVGKHDAAGLDEAGLDVLVPFVPMRLRRRVRAAGSERRAALAAELSGLLVDMSRALRAGRAAGRLSGEDEALLAGLADELVTQEFVERFEEFKEANAMAPMVKLRWERAWDEALEQGREEGRGLARRELALRMIEGGLADDDIARYSGLTPAEVTELRRSIS
ncbi:MAG: hypothetical protein LBR33_12305 [Propionibacteriaceae bacterium]|jgi:hypothetical protein|nr:hypothetical protein [Propionibacteriaceae bacterium]